MRVPKYGTQAPIDGIRLESPSIQGIRVSLCHEIGAVGPPQLPNTSQDKGCGKPPWGRTFPYLRRAEARKRRLPATEPALCDVADDPGEEGSFSVAPRCQRHLNRKLVP